MVNVLTEENVIIFAQDVMPLMVFDCEWGGICESELNSWNALREVSVTVIVLFHRCCTAITLASCYVKAGM